MVTRQRWNQIKYPDRNKARQRVHSFVKIGKIKKATEYFCVDCGKPAKEFDHYLGYKELYHYAVMPVCIACHKKRKTVSIEGVNECHRVRDGSVVIYAPERKCRKCSLELKKYQKAYCSECAKSAYKENAREKYWQKKSLWQSL